MNRNPKATVAVSLVAAAATLLAFVSPYITLAICAVVAAYYAHPAASGGQVAA